MITIKLAFECVEYTKKRVFSQAKKTVEQGVFSYEE
jgi:hypothetical protein